MRIIVGVTGASGVEMSCALVETLKSFPDCAVHLVVSDAGAAELGAGDGDAL